MAGGEDDLRALARRLKDVNDATLKREFNKSIRDAVTPLKRALPASALRTLPKKNGLAKRVAESKISIRKQQHGVTLVMKNDFELKKLDDPGINRHPVFPRRTRLQRATRTNRRRPALHRNRKKWTWVSQRVKPGWFTKPANLKGRDAAKAIEDAVKRVAREIEGR